MVTFPNPVQCSLFVSARAEDYNLSYCILWRNTLEHFDVWNSPFSNIFVVLRCFFWEIWIYPGKVVRTTSKMLYNDTDKRLQVRLYFKKYGESRRPVASFPQRRSRNLKRPSSCSCASSLCILPSSAESAEGEAIQMDLWKGFPKILLVLNCSKTPLSWYQPLCSNEFHNVAFGTPFKTVHLEGCAHQWKVKVTSDISDFVIVLVVLSYWLHQWLMIRSNGKRHHLIMKSPVTGRQWPPAGRWQCRFGPCIALGFPGGNSWPWWEALWRWRAVKELREKLSYWPCQVLMEELEDGIVFVKISWVEWREFPGIISHLNKSGGWLFDTCFSKQVSIPLSGWLSGCVHKVAAFNPQFHPPKRRTFGVATSTGRCLAGECWSCERLPRFGRQSVLLPCTHVSEWL